MDAFSSRARIGCAYGRALDAVKEFGIPLDAAAIEYAEAGKVLTATVTGKRRGSSCGIMAGQLPGKAVADAV